MTLTFQLHYACLEYHCDYKSDRQPDAHNEQSRQQNFLILLEELDQPQTDIKYIEIYHQKNVHTPYQTLY